MTESNEPCCGPGCCVPAEDSIPDPVNADAVRAQVRAGYATIAKAGTWHAANSDAGDTGCGTSAGGGACCGPVTFDAAELAAAIGYTDDDLAAMPEGANMGLSCGKPNAIASLRPGEVVLDLGAGGGFDCFVAARKVGPTGRVIGVDMTADMVSKARRNVAAFTGQTGLSNVEFRLGEIENLPVADASVDVVISNCVLNLSPDKPRVWQEIARVLKPGGRVAVSDLALLKPLPEAIRSDIEALVGCIAGAVLVEEMHRHVAAAGLTEIVLSPKRQYVDAMLNWEDPLYRRIVAGLPEGSTAGDYITSVDVSAHKAVPH